MGTNLAERGFQGAVVPTELLGRCKNPGDFKRVACDVLINGWHGGSQILDNLKEVRSLAEEWAKEHKGVFPPTNKQELFFACFDNAADALVDCPPRKVEAVLRENLTGKSSMGKARRRLEDMRQKK